MNWAGLALPLLGLVVAVWACQAAVRADRCAGDAKARAERAHRNAVGALIEAQRVYLWRAARRR